MFGWVRRLDDLDERGASLVITAAAMVSLLGLAAVAVDVGMGFAARAQAQRIADSAALAGASAFLDPVDEVTQEETAHERANTFATANDILGRPVPVEDVTVQVLTDERKVRVGIRRTGLGTWFARVWGIGTMDIGAVAAAEATEAGAAKCVKPFAIPDMWSEWGPGEEEGDHDDLNRNGLWDPTDDNPEEWLWGDDGTETYEQWISDETNGTSATGYGSTARDGIPDAAGDVYYNDVGRPLRIKVTDPNSVFQISSGIFFPFRMPEDPDRPGCGGGPGATGDSGANVYRDNICECNGNPIDFETEYPLEPGNMLGPTNQAIDVLFSEDSGASLFWDDNGNWEILNSSEPNPMDSPRLIKVALYDPWEVSGSGMQYITFNNIALLWLEEQASRRDPIVARFLEFAPGSGGGGPTVGPLVLTLRLVE
jgi:hypothetical protein